MFKAGLKVFAYTVVWAGEQNQYAVHSQYTPAANRVNHSTRIFFAAKTLLFLTDHCGTESETDNVPVDWIV